MVPCIPQHTIWDRLTVLEPLARTADVLDLGIADSWSRKGPTEERVKNDPDLLFRRLANVNPNVVGVDLDRDGVNALRAEGFSAECADVETMDLGRQFDLIVAGEIIEHLLNPGLCLLNLRRHIKPGGTLAVSTPNPFYAKQRHKIWRYGRPTVHDDHVAWFDPITLDHLMRRTGWLPTDAYWVQPAGGSVKTWTRLLRRYFSHSFLMLARPDVESSLR